MQGLAWTANGAMWASEFGQNAWDELNRIEPGGNYGWPLVEGAGGDDHFVDPVAVWTPAEASPSGIAAVGDTVFVAGLRGARLWAVDGTGGEASVPLEGRAGCATSSQAPTAGSGSSRTTPTAVGRRATAAMCSYGRRRARHLTPPGHPAALR